MTQITLKFTATELQILTGLVADVKNGRAVELGAIKPTLESLTTDVAVLERVRTRAQQLLDVIAQQEKPAQ